MNTTEEKAKPTSGPWHLRDGNTMTVLGTSEMAYPYVCSTYTGNMHRIEQDRANAQLIAEAGTVYHETKLTPRELLQQRDDLLYAAQLLIMDLQERGNHMQGDAVKILQEAIKKATE